MRRRDGVALVVVLVFVLLLTSQIATFMRRATVDAMISRHHDAAAEAEALARGGVRLAVSLLLEDRLQEEAVQFRVESPLDAWARVDQVPVSEDGEASLRLRIQDAGSRFNLNALVDGEGAARKNAELVLVALLEKVIGEIPADQPAGVYDPRELARELLDFIDRDEVRSNGGSEDAYYQRQTPPYKAANRPLLSLEELRMVEGFDGVLMEALEPYLTVHPQAGGDGINPNTAPAHVLGLLYHGVSEEYRLADAEQVADVLALRETGGIWCDETASHEGCHPLAEVVPGEIYPPPSFTASVFTVVSRATVGEVTRSVEAVLDRGELPAITLLAWRTR